jgi:hypothetical protein
MSDDHPATTPDHRARVTLPHYELEVMRPPAVPAGQVCLAVKAPFAVILLPMTDSNARSVARALDVAGLVVPQPRPPGELPNLRQLNNLPHSRRP